MKILFLYAISIFCLVLSVGCSSVASEEKLAEAILGCSPNDVRKYAAPALLDKELAFKNSYGRSTPVWKATALAVSSRRKDFKNDLGLSNDQVLERQKQILLVLRDEGASMMIDGESLATVTTRWTYNKGSSFRGIDNLVGWLVSNNFGAVQDRPNTLAEIQRRKIHSKKMAEEGARRYQALKKEREEEERIRASQPTKIVECSKCNGWGSYRPTTFPHAEQCPRCRGAGRIRVRRD